MSEPLGTRALARALGVSSSSVTRAVKEGRITPSSYDGKRAMFDLEAVRAQWKTTTAPLDSTGRSGLDSTGRSGLDSSDAPTGSDMARYNKARADKEEAIAAQELLTLAEMEKTLLPRDELVLGFTQFLRTASQALSGLPAKTLSRYPGLTAEGRDFLTEELRIILDDLGEWTPSK